MGVGAPTSHMGLLQLKLFSFSDGANLSCSSLSRYFLSTETFTFYKFKLLTGIKYWEYLTDKWNKQQN